MSDAFYEFVCIVGRPIFRLSSTPTLLHLDRLRSFSGPLILAPNHLSPYDVPCLMAHSRRPLDFVSITELFQNRLSAWFLGSMNAFPLDRGRIDPVTTRRILMLLERGRIVAMFPEGRIRAAGESLLSGAVFKPSVLRLARLAGVPIMPCVVLGTGAYRRASAWLPLHRTRYAVGFGEPFTVREETPDDATASSQAMAQLRQRYLELYDELRAASGLAVADPAPPDESSRAPDVHPGL
jgi:1-acyl-sn-glycerol-3-phosphate acyltransferase